MKNSKLFKSLSAVALAGIMAFSSISLVSAEETQITDKQGVSIVFENQAGVKYLSNEDQIRMIEIMYGDNKTISELGITLGSETPMVYVVDKDTNFYVDYSNSAISKENVKDIFAYLVPLYRDDNGVLQGATGTMGESVVGYNCFVDMLCSHIPTENSSISHNSQHFSFEGYESEFERLGVDSKINIYNQLDCGCEKGYSGESLQAVVDWTNPAGWGNSHGTGMGPQSLLPAIDDYKHAIFLSCLCVEYIHPETEEEYMNWVYFVTEEALANEINPVEFLDEKPADNTPEPTDEVKEVTLTEDNAVISKDDMAALITENATKDVVIKTTAGITLTFAKGTMKAVDGKDTYDFGVSMSDDYSKHSNMGVVTKDNFVSLIDFNYSGNLPAEATVKIPVGTDRAGQTLYYSQKVEAGYTLVQSVKVDDEGYITVKQDHCSTYVVTTTDVSKDNSADVPAGPNETPDTGDTNNVMIYIALFVVTGAMLVVLAGSKMRKRA